MEINFIKDEVLNLNKEKDLLGTMPYSITLFDLISKSAGKKNVGLFGSWGSGKSTILKTLQNLIDNHNSLKKNKNNNFGYFEFDAWKYSKDDFRRSFILEINSEFNVLPKPELEKLIYNEKTVEEKGKYRFSFSLPEWIIAILVLLALLFYFLPILDINKDIRAVISLFALTITVLSAAIGKTINQYKVVVKENKLIEPERFEEIFKETIDEITTIKSNFIRKWIQKNLLKKRTFSKVVVVIDNLDRCDDENLMVTLNTIKNFLEHEKVIFILPVDEKGVSAFLSEKTDNPEEFLRKIFHLIIRLKEFSRKELYEFTSKLNDIYNLKLTYDSITLICQEFTGNPRKVIQFLNNYQSEIKLIEEQSKLGYVNLSFVMLNLNFFIKILIIKYEWRDLYSCLLYDKSLLNKINSVITNLQEDGDGCYLISDTGIKLSDEQRNFFYSTQHIHCGKLDPFILNIDLDIDIPDEIIENIRYANFNKLVEYLNHTEHKFEPADLLKKMNETYSDITFKQRGYNFIALPLMDLLIKFISDEKQVKFRKELENSHKRYNFLKSLPDNIQIYEIFDKLDFEKISNTIYWLLNNVNSIFYTSFQNYFIVRYLSDSEQDNHILNIEVFLNTFKDSSVLKGIQSKFSSHILSKPNVSKISVLKNYEVSSQIISKTTINKMSEYLLKEAVKTNSYDYEQILFNHFIANKSNKILQRNLTNHLIKEFNNFYDLESGIELNLHVDYLYYFEKLIPLLEDNENVQLLDFFQTKVEFINEYFLELYNQNFDEKSHLKIYYKFLEFVQALIFNVKEFNNVENRNKYFRNYLDKGYYKEIDLKVNILLQADINKYDVYKYPFAESLIEKFKNFSSDEKYEFAETLLLMIKKSNENDRGLNNTQKDEIIRVFVDNFSFYSFQNQSLEYLNEIKIYEQNILEKYINDENLSYPLKYIKSVSKHSDNWFYGESVFNYLKKNNSNRNTFFKKIKEIFEIVPVEIQKNAIKNLLLESTTLLKWLRLSYKFLDKKVFDIYLSSLLEGHKESKIGHNDFLEWIIKIPTKKYLSVRKNEFKNYLESLDINHKTYQPKVEKAIKHFK